MENFKIIHNVESNKIEQVALLPNEIAQKAKDASDAQALIIAKEQAKIAKDTAQAKLAALGLTTDDLKALGL